MAFLFRVTNFDIDMLQYNVNIIFELITTIIIKPMLP